MENNQNLDKRRGKKKVIQLRTGFFLKGAYQKRCVFNEAVELLKNYYNSSFLGETKKNNSILPSTFFQNFQCCNNGFIFGIRIEDDTIVTLWVYWLVKSLTCFNVHIYALSIKSCLLFYSFIYDIHFFLVKGKGKRSV